jgi:hypothetical protein
MLEDANADGLEGRPLPRIKLVDFGLSKITGPNEKCKEPFGTIVSRFLINRLMSLLKFLCKNLMIRKLTYGV